MINRCIVILSTKVDATIKSYQPDTDVQIFKTLTDCGNCLEHEVIRADAVYITKDVLVNDNSVGLNTQLTYLQENILNNPYLSTDAVIYITEKDSSELRSIRHLVEIERLPNIEIIEGNLTRAYITDVINGTLRNDNFDSKRKAVYRKPRADYVRDKLIEKTSLDEDYISDDEAYIDLYEESLPVRESTVREFTAKRVYIAGDMKSHEFNSFTFLAAQYYSLKGKTVLLESDADFHVLSEYATKSGVSAYILDIMDIYNDVNLALENIRKSDKNLIVIICKDKISIAYHTWIETLFYNLINDISYIIVQRSLSRIPEDTECVVVVPSTLQGCFATSLGIHIHDISHLLFVGVDLNYLPQIHISSGVVMSTLLQDLFSNQNLMCPVVTITNLKLDGTAYDLGCVLGKGV